MSQRGHAQFFFKVADLGSELQDENLRDAARSILKLIPPDSATVNRLQVLFGDSSLTVDDPQPTVDNTFFCDSPSQVLYNLEVSYYLKNYDGTFQIYIKLKKKMYTFTLLNHEYDFRFHAPM